MYLHSLPTLKERTEQVKKQLFDYLRKNLTDKDISISVNIESDICLSVVTDDIFNNYDFDFLGTDQSNFGTFTHVSFKLN